jgi:hypothetical protein
VREYSQFQASFWTGETGKKLHGNVDAQLVAAYLFTCRHSNQIGLYYLPLVYAVNDLGMGIDRVSAALDAVSAARFATYDSASEHVWVFKMAPKQVTRSPKAIGGAVKELRLAADTRLKRAFIAAYGIELSNLHSDTVRIPYADFAPSVPTDTVSVPYPESTDEHNKTITRPDQEQTPPAGERAGACVCDAAEFGLVASDLDAANEQVETYELAEVPPVGANSAEPELEPGEPEPGAKPSEPEPRVRKPISDLAITLLKEIIAAEAFALNFERTPRCAENYYRQAAEDCRDVAVKRGEGTREGYDKVCQELVRVALKRLVAEPNTSFGFALQDAALGRPARPKSTSRTSGGGGGRQQYLERPAGSTAEGSFQGVETYEQQKARMRAEQEAERAEGVTHA